MSSISLALLALSLAAPAPKGTASSGDWPQWRGPNRDGHSSATGLLQKWPAGGPKLLYKTDRIGAGYGSPAVVGGKLYILGTLNAGSEDMLDGDQEVLWCLEAATGKEIWKSPVGQVKKFDRGSGPRSTPTFDGDLIFVLDPSGELVALKLADGKKAWSRSLVNDFGGRVPGWGYSESILIDGDKLICTPGGNKGAIVALNKTSGELIWQSEDLKEPAGYSSVIVAEVGGVRQYIQQTMKGTCGVRASDGEVLWNVADAEYRTAVIPTPVFYKDHVFVSSGYGAGCKLIKLSKAGTSIKAETVYKSKVITNHHGGIIRVGEHLYGHSDQGGQWVCLDVIPDSIGDDGPKPEWTSRKLGKGSVSFADGHLYCYSERDGETVLVKADPTEWKEAGRFKIPEKSKLRPGNSGVWAHPVIAEGKLYLREYEWLFCYDVTGKE
jgi:outer membrane protein assembly factor BamB